MSRIIVFESIFIFFELIYQILFLIKYYLFAPLLHLLNYLLL